MKSLILFAALLIGMAACETPAPATGSETTVDSSSATTTTPMSTDTTSTDTSTMKRDSL